MRRLLFATLIVLPLAAAAEAGPPSDAYLELGRDSSKSIFGTAALDLGLPNGDLLTVTGASNRVKSRSSPESTVTRSLYASYLIDPDALWSFAPALEIWAARADLSSRSAMVEVDLNKTDWTFALQPELKSLSWVVADGQTKKRTGAAGLHAHIDYLGWSHWSVSVRAGGFNYGGQKFQNFLYSYVVSDSALAQSSALVKSYAGASLSYLLPKWTISGNLQKSNYVVGGITTLSFSADLKYHFDTKWSLGYGLTSSKPNDASAILSNAINAMYSW